MARRQRSPREKALVLITMLVVAGVGGYQFAYLPVLERYEALQADVAVEREAALLDTATFANLGKIKREFERRQESLKMAGSQGEMEAQILSQINEIFEKNNVFYVSYDVRDAKQVEDFKVFSFEFSGIACQMSDLFHLLDAIQNCDQVLEVTQITIERKGGRARNWPAEQVIADMTISRLVSSPDKRQPARRSSNRRS
jgi:hypothetical protein